jgi:hypothetical protein
LAVLAALALSLVISAGGADARLKSEWKFGGSLAQTIMSIPVASAVLGGAFGGNFGGNLGGMSAFDDSTLPSAAQPSGGSLGELFSRPGLVGGFAAGFLGAGVLGVLFGHGIYGELSGVASVLGLILQLALILMLGRLIWTWWRADTPAFADLSPRQLADAYGRPRHEALPNIDSDTCVDAGLGEKKADPFK